MNSSNGSANIASRQAIEATPVLTCGLKLSPDIFGTNVVTWAINAASVAGSPWDALNALIVPLSAVNGFTAATISACNHWIAGVGFENKKGTLSMLFGTAVAVRRMTGSDSFGFDRQGTEHGEVDA